jgi:hypothetical protein
MATVTSINNTTTSTSEAPKAIKITYWISTSIFFLLDSVMPAFTFNTPLAKQGISHMGFPDYFRIELSVGKIIGGILLILPMIPARFKEWAYVGFGISLISAFVGLLVLNEPGEGGFAIFGMAILLTSYFSYHKMKSPFKPGV